MLGTKSFGIARHTGDNINIQLISITENFSITEKIVAVSNDNAKNMVNGVEFAEFESIRCTHTLQLSINDALDDSRIQKLVEKCRQLIGHLKQSTLSMNRFKKLQEQNGLIQHKLIQEMVVRWNTSYYMIERIQEQKAAIQQFYLEEDLNIDKLVYLTKEDFHLIQSLINVLQAGDFLSTFKIRISLYISIYIDIC